MHAGYYRFLMGQQKRGLYKRNIVWQGRAWSPGEGILTVYGEQNSRVNRFTKIRLMLNMQAVPIKIHEWKIFLHKGVQAGNTLVDEQKQAGVGNGRKKICQKVPGYGKMDGRGNAGQPPCGQVTGCIYQVEKKDCKQQCQGKIRKM